MNQCISVLFFLVAFIVFATGQVTNDSPCVGGENPPVFLISGVLIEGNTCGANGYNDDPLLEVANITCNDMSLDDSAIWYYFIPDSTSHGFNISVKPSISVDTFLVEIYSTSNITNGCEDGILGSYEIGVCGVQDFYFEQSFCGASEKDYMFVKIATSSNNCGSFDIVYNDFYGCQSNDFTALVDGEFYDPDNDGVAGPFYPGQEVEVCWSFNYNSTMSGNDWLHGLIPSFGNGWEVDYTKMNNVLNDEKWQWFSAEDECYPRVTNASMPNNCTYMENGVLKICNMVCNDYCPCEESLEPEDRLPSAWFWNTPACDQGSCPHEEYGVLNGVNIDLTGCVNLVVKSFCDTSNEFEGSDLSISIHPTADGTTGCWFDPKPCNVFPPYSSPPWKSINVSNEAVQSVTIETCSQSQTSLFIEVNSEFDENDFVLLKEYSSDSVYIDQNFRVENDSVFLDLELDNYSLNNQSIKLFLYDSKSSNVNDELLFCIDVLVYSLISVDFDMIEYCGMDSLSINILDYIHLVGGSGNYVDYYWEQLEQSGEVQTFLPEQEVEYCIVVTDSIGCQRRGCFYLGNEPEVIVVEEVTVCNNNVELGNSVVNFNDLVISQDTGIWRCISHSIDEVDSIINFEGFNADNYLFEFSSDHSSVNCSELRDTLSVNVEECPCFGLVDTFFTCTDLEMLHLDSLLNYGSSDFGNWTSSEASFFIFGDETLLDLTDPGSYQIVFNPLLDMNDCQIQDSTIVVVDNYETAIVDRYVEVCNSEEYNHKIDFISLLNSTDTIGIWLDRDGLGVDMSDLSEVSFAGVPAKSSYYFEYIIPNAGACNDFIATIEVVVLDCFCPEVLVEVEHTDPSCFEGMDGRIFLNADNIDQLHFDWSFAAFGNEVNVSAGMYYVTVSNTVVGCIDTLSIEIDEPPLLSLSLNFDDDAVVNAVVSGGTEPYQYLWSTGEVTSSIVAENDVLYTVTVTDSNGCSEEGQFEIVNTLELWDGIAVYPNPFKNHIFLSGDIANVESLRLIDAMGRLVALETNVSANLIQVDVADLVSGIYYLEIKRDSVTNYFRMVHID